MMESLVQTGDYRAAAVCTAALLGLLITWHVTRKKYRWPPGLMALPLIGNIQLMTMKEMAYEKFLAMSKQPEYGGIITIQIATIKAVVLTSLETVREALVEKKDDFAGRPSLESFNYMTSGGKDILMAQFGPTLKFHRMLVHKAIRNYAAGKHLEQILQRTVDKTVNEILKEEGKSINIRPHLSLLVVNIVSGICFGKEFDLDDPDFVKIRTLTTDFTEAMGSGFVADFIPGMKYIPTPAWKRFKQLSNDFMSILTKQFKEHQEQFDPVNPKDFTDFLLLTQREAEDENVAEKDLLDDTHLLMTLVDVFGAGLDTITGNLHWMVAFLTKNQEVQAKLHAELDSVLGKEKPTLAVKDKLQYTEAVMCETLRMSSIFPLGVPLKTTRDTTIGAYDVPKDTMVLSNTWGLNNDKDNWGDPENYRPERFLGEDNRVITRPPYFIPFSLGRRQCIGEALAKSELMMIIPSLMQRLKFQPPNGEPFTIKAMRDSGFLHLPQLFDVIAYERK